MSVSNRIWEMLGDVEPEEFQHLLNNLFAVYEEKLESDPENGEALAFFHYLEGAINKTTSCNANRR